jgi:Holliday junction resolvasome RuvABC DNA-binding subunit
MNSLNPLQGNSALSQLLALQSSTQTSVTQPNQANSSQSTATDSLSISDAALQALKGLGQDPAQIQQAQTYTAKGHHHHHHGGAQAQSASGSPSTQLSQVSEVQASTLQAKS